jgi:hypothetical protein
LAKTLEMRPQTFLFMLEHARRREMIPVIHRGQEKHDDKWQRVVLHKTSKCTLEVLDETSVEVLDKLDMGDNHGPMKANTLWAYPDEDSIEKALRVESKAKVYERAIHETPRRKREREVAHQHQIDQARGMKKKATKIQGDIEVGTVVQVPLADVDRGRVDNSTLTLVVVEVRGTKESKQYRLACEKGTLNRFYARSYINVVPNVTPKLMGLHNVLLGWQGMPQCTEREASKLVSTMGGGKV